MRATGAQVRIEGGGINKEKKDIKVEGNNDRNDKVDFYLLKNLKFVGTAKLKELTVVPLNVLLLKDSKFLLCLLTHHELSTHHFCI